MAASDRDRASRGASDGAGAGRPRIKTELRRRIYVYASEREAAGTSFGQDAGFAQMKGHKRREDAAEASMLEELDKLEAELQELRAAAHERDQAALERQG